MRRPSELRLFSRERGRHASCWRTVRGFVQGDVTVYETRGSINLSSVLGVARVGALQIASKTQAEARGGRAVRAGTETSAAEISARIGLVTSPTGAAIRDVLHVVRRRIPALEIILAPCRVQGERRGEEIAGGHPVSQ